MNHTPLEREAMRFSGVFFKIGEKGKDGMAENKHTIIPVFISFAGCPHRCVFCNQQVINGQQDNSLASAKRQIAEAEQWVKPSSRNELAFFGGSFTALPLERQKELLTLADNKRKEGLFGELRLSTRPDAITPEILEQMKAFHVKTVELGVQSLDDEVLKRAERGHTARDVKDAAALLRQYGFSVGLQLMVGLPGQDWESLRRTCHEVCELAPDCARIYPLLVIAGTKLASWYQKGEYTPLSLKEAVVQTAYLHERLEAHNIQVIRMGLQPDKELCAPGHILDGPFHPAFGELVRSYEYRISIQSLIEAQPDGNYNMIITCPERLTSILRGQHRCNIRAWEASGRIHVEFRKGDKVGVNFYDRETL
jgi:histone acetyltransferase (RNA polymerase elongator complex component)